MSQLHYLKQKDLTKRNKPGAEWGDQLKDQLTDMKVISINELSEIKFFSKNNINIDAETVALAHSARQY